MELQVHTYMFYNVCIIFISLQNYELIEMIEETKNTECL